MAFWGVEVRPGKPYTHRCNDARGRLRISLATLGIKGESKGKAKCVLQCNVGEKSPVLLCSLIADAAETCHLELEFEESEDVVFSVVGPKSVHLSGYYVRPSHGRDGDETDSYGEDIGEDDSEESFGSLDDEEDDYESDFIDDGDIEMFPSSPRRKSGVVIEEIIEDDKPANGNGTHRRLKKKCMLSDTDDDDNGSRQLVVKSNSSHGLESEDEDGFPISISVKKRTADTVCDDKSSDAKTMKGDKKRKIGMVSKNYEFARGTCQTDNSLKVKDGKSGETVSKMSFNETLNSEQKSAEEKPVAEDKFDITESEQKPKKKNKKEKAKRGKTYENGCSLSSGGLDEFAKADPNEVTNIDGMDQNCEAHKGEEASRKTKKTKKKSKDEHGQLENVTMDNSNLDDDLPDKKSPTNEPSDDKSVPQLSDKKRNKKSKDKNLDDSVKTDKRLVETKEELENKTRTFANGLIVEELSMGKPDGKKASAGKRVFMNYIGKLKSGKIFDSNVGGRPFRFRLGIGEVIKGWDVGVNGMRVGDKRRLTIPPSMGYGNKNLPQIPANSWLVFDVELVDVK